MTKGKKLAATILATLALSATVCAAPRSASEQIQIFAETANSGQEGGWFVSPEKDANWNRWFYAVTDLDHDGKLEFVAASQHPQSRSTNLRCGIGGYKGRALMAGDVIALRAPENGRKDLSWRWVPPRRLVSPDDPETTKVRVIPGPQEDMFTEEGLRTFYESTYVITSHSDRMGYRLTGPKVEAVNGYDILSDGIVNGSVQISGAGEPIVMMADRQTTGGYAKIASLINVDIPLFAQLRPGQEVMFVRCTVQEAQKLMREADRKWKEHCRILEKSKPAGFKVLGIRAQDNDGGSRSGWKRRSWKQKAWKRGIKK